MNALYAALESLLMADSALTTTLGVTGVYKNKAPQSSPAQPVAPPYVIFAKQGGLWDTNHNGGVIREPRLFVKVVDAGPSAVRAGLIDERVAELLNAQVLDTVEGRYRAFRTGDMPDFDEDIPGGLRYQHVGGNYKFVRA